jgi:hypothetical protein
MSTFQSLQQGGSFKEGFNSRQEIDKSLDDFFVGADELKVDGLSFSEITDNVQRDYNTLFCLKPVGTPGEGEDQAYEQGEEGECIWSSLNSEELCSGNDGRCQRPPERNNLDKIIKEGGNYYYINKYGYKKPLGSNKNEFDPTCISKTILENSTEGEYLSSAVYFNDNLSPTMKSCTNGNYNLEFCKSDGKCDYAYYSPKGEVKVYGEKTWEDLKNTQCRTLPVVNVKTSGDSDETSFANTNSGNEKWGQRDTATFSDDLGNSKLEGKTNIEKARIIKGCLPFHGESGLSGYQKNLENKLLSEVQVLEMQKKWTEKLNKANKMFFNDGEDGVNGALKEELKEWYGTESGYCKKIDGERVCLDRHGLSEDYRKKIKELDVLQDTFISKKDSFKETELKMDTLFVHRLLWLGSAVVLGAIALKQIRNP